MKKNHDFFVIVLVMRIFMQFSPALDVRTSLIINFPILVFLYLYVFINSHDKLFNKFLGVLPIFIAPIINQIGVNGGNVQVVNIVYLLFQWLVWPVVGFFVVDNMSHRSQKINFWAFLACFVITAITTIYGCVMFPGAPRQLANGHFVQENADFVAVYKGVNIGDFQFVYTLVLLVPIILCACNYYFRRKILGYLIIILFVYAIYQTEYTTALLLSSVSIVFLILPVARNSKNAIRWLVSITVISLISFPLLADLLQFLASSLSGDDLTTRLSELSLSLSGEQLDESTDLGSRIYFWKLSLTTFFEHFLTGVFFSISHEQVYSFIGGHSFILDTMARFGVVGLLLIIWMFKTIYRLYIKPYRNRPEYIYILVVYLLNIIQCLLNTLSIEIVFVFLIPLFLSLSHQKIQESRTILV